MTVFNFDDYRTFIRQKIGPRSGFSKGTLTKLADRMGVQSSFLSQVLKGDKSLSVEQGFLIAQFFNLTEIESRFLELLISKDRAQKAEYREYLNEQMLEVKNKFFSEKGLNSIDQPLDEQNQAIFYSSWHYSAVQLACGISDGCTANSIASTFQIEVTLASRILSFLVETGMCKYNGATFSIGPRRTHLVESSPFRVRHNTNWRMKAMERMPSRTPEDFFHTAPMRIDKGSYEKIRKMVSALTSEVDRTIDEARDEQLACLNIDLFNF